MNKIIINNITFLLLILLLLGTNMQINAQNVNLPHIWDFEDSSSVNNWTNHGTGLTNRSNIYKHNGTYSLVISSSSALSPELNVTTLGSYMIEGYCYSTTDNATFTIGVMVDSTDTSTYTVLSHITIPNRNTWTDFLSFFSLLHDPDYCEYYDSKYIVISVDSNIIYFDDLNVYLSPTCPKPTDVIISNIGAHSFDIGFRNNSYASQSSVLINGIEHIISNNPATITGLTANTNYNVQIASICSINDTSSYSSTISFQTSGVQTQPFDCSFESSETTTNEWLFAGSNNEFVIGSGAQSMGSRALYISNDSSSWNYTLNSVSNSYAYIPLTFRIGTYNIEFDWQAKGESNNDYGRVFLAPPSFVPTAGIMSSGISATTTPTGWIALDNNSSLSQSSGWQHIATEQTFTDSTTMNLIVFWHNNGSAGTQPPFAIDYIHINNSVRTIYYDTICHGEAYNEHGFYFSAGQLLDGDTTITSNVYTYSNGVADSIITINIHVRPNITTEIYDTICYGQPYNRGLIQIANPSTYTYYCTFTSVTTGCDSTVNLHLYIFPSNNETINDTICQGDYYQFGNQNLTTTGTYYDTITNKWGCQITTTLNLFVVDTVTVTNARICEGEYWIFAGERWNQSGKYTTVSTSHGCPYTQILNLDVIEPDAYFNLSLCQDSSINIADTTITTAGQYNFRQFIPTDTDDNPYVGCFQTCHVTVTEVPLTYADVYDFTCKGIPYSNYGIENLIVNQDTVISVVTKVPDNCDSVTNIYLTCLQPSHSEHYAVITEGQTYTQHGKTYTKAGDYSDTLIAANGCDSIITLHLDVVGQTAVDDANDIVISIIPNPVKAGESSTIYGDVGDVKSVEIINNFGQVMENSRPTGYPINIPALQSTGIYWIRLVTTTGKTHLAKLVVI